MTFVCVCCVSCIPSGNAQCAHRGSFLRLYVIGDSVGGTANLANPYVWSSLNEWNWTSTLAPATVTAWTTGATTPRQLLYTGCVVDMQDRVYSLGVSDVWMSATNGSTWSNVNPTTMYSPRQAFAYGIFTGASGTDIMAVVGGLSTGNTLLNDVWASQTGGASWVRTTYAAPWQPRVGANLAVFVNGVMVVHGGSTSIPAQAAGSYFSDAWISFDCAQTWQLLIASTGITRSMSAVTFDQQGYLFVFSGYTSSNAGATDGWRSNYAIGNLQAWGNGATATALSVPSGYAACRPYVNAPTASAQQPGSSSNSSSGLSNGAIAGIVIGSVVGGVLILILLCLILRGAGRGSKSTRKASYDSHRDDSRATGEDVEMTN